jgi:hypothetical protein
LSRENNTWLTDEEKLALAAEWMICADYREPDPPARLMGAVEKGDTDIVTAWRPERHAGMGRDAARGRDLGLRGLRHEHQ